MLNLFEHIYTQNKLFSWDNGYVSKIIQFTTQGVTFFPISTKLAHDSDSEEKMGYKFYKP